MGTDERDAEPVDAGVDSLARNVVEAIDDQVVFVDWAATDPELVGLDDVEVEVEPDPETESPETLSLVGGDRDDGTVSAATLAEAGYETVTDIQRAMDRTRVEVDEETAAALAEAGYTPSSGRRRGSPTVEVDRKTADEIREHGSDADVRPPGVEPLDEIPDLSTPAAAHIRSAAATRDESAGPPVETQRVTVRRDGETVETLTKSADERVYLDASGDGVVTAEIESPRESEDDGEAAAATDATAGEDDTEETAERETAERNDARQGTRSPRGIPDPEAIHDTGPSTDDRDDGPTADRVEDDVYLGVSFGRFRRAAPIDVVHISEANPLDHGEVRIPDGDGEPEVYDIDGLDESTDKTVYVHSSTIADQVFRTGAGRVTMDVDVDRDRGRDGRDAR